MQYGRGRIRTSLPSITTSEDEGVQTGRSPKRVPVPGLVDER
jgi:hypothetical protein